LRRLETITHPLISHQLRERLDQLRAARRHRAVVLDAAVMFQSGWQRMCDKIVYVDVPEATRIARAAARGWNADEVARREARQTPLAEKRRHADAVIDNSGSVDATRHQVAALWQSWVGACEVQNQSPT
jgi:dephospho-CoA kinase